jgi:hypothetical protein
VSAVALPAVLVLRVVLDVELVLGLVLDVELVLGFVLDVELVLMLVFGLAVEPAPLLDELHLRRLRWRLQH